MPPEKRRRGDADGGPAVPWDRSACHREEHPVNGPELRRTAGPLEDPELMAENEDLEILRAIVQATGDEEAGEHPNHEVQEEQHRRSLRCGPVAKPGFRPPRAAAIEQPP